MPAALIGSAGRDAWIVFLVYTAAEFVSLAMILLAYRAAPDKDFYQLLEEGIGKTAAVITVIFFAAYQMCAVLLVLSDMRIFLTRSLFENTEWAFLAFPLVIAAGFAALKGLKNIGRAALLLTPVILGALLFVLVTMFFNNDPAGALPVLGDGTGAVFKGIKLYPVFIESFTVTAAILGNVKKGRWLFRGSLIAAGFASALGFILIFILSINYGGVKNLIGFGTPADALTQFSPFTQGFGRINAVAFTFMLPAAFISLTLGLYACAKLLACAFKAEKIEFWILLALTVTAYVLTAVLFKNEEEVYYFMSGWLRIPALVFKFGIPLLIMLLGLKSNMAEKRKKRAEGDENA